MKKLVITVAIAATLLPGLTTATNVQAQDFKTKSVESSYNVNKDILGYFEPNYSNDNEGTPFKKIPNTEYEVSLVGKGDNGQEEGKASILINNGGRLYKYIFNGKTDNQLTPLKVVDGYGTNLIVLVGNGWGSMQTAKYIYSLDVENGISTLLYTSDKDHIADAKVDGNKLNIKKFSVSDSWTNYQEYNISVNFNKCTSTFGQVDPSQSLKHSDFNTPFKKIQNTNYQGSIAGKGDNGQEEGIGSLLIKDETSNKYYEYKYINREHSQKCPLKIIGGNGDNIWIIVGGAHGSMPNGQYIYSLNVKTGVSDLIYEEKGDYSIVDAKIEGNKIHLKNFDAMDYHTFEKTVDIKR